MVNVREWLDENYPLETRKDIKELNIGKRNLEINPQGIETELEGYLNLRDFINLEKLNCSRQNITSLYLSSCLRLKELNCSRNQISELDLTYLNNLTIVYCSDNKIDEINLGYLPEIIEFSCGNNRLTDLGFLLQLSSEKLKDLWINNNNFPSTDLTCFSHFVNLEVLRIGNWNRERVRRGISNRFCGSLKPLKNLTKLRSLGIETTDVDSGLEYLSDTIEKISCHSYRDNMKVSIIKKNLELYHGNLRKWKKNNPDLLIVRWKEEAIWTQKTVTELKEKNASLEEELQMEREEVEKALQKAQEWRERQLKEITTQKDREIQELKAQLEKLQLQTQIQVFPK